MEDRVYIAIDLKSFYASVECVERGLDPLDANLVVADVSRTEKTICLAVSPSLKSFKIPGRARLFEVIAKLKEVNGNRRRCIPSRKFTGKSYIASEINENPNLEIDYIAAPPRMALYMEYSTRIYDVYLKYVAPEDMHVYSVDEVFLDVTEYLQIYKMTPTELARTIIKDVLNTTGITATAGIGTNMYLCKIAMDIVAKHMEADENGVRIAELDEMSYRKLLWNHTPITDFWRVGKGYAKKLEAHGMYTMGDVARCSIGKATDYYNEDLLYKMFGVNAELLIDHAWGWEPTRISDVREYKPENNSLSSGQVLSTAYTTSKARIVMQEMADLLALDLVDKGLVTDQLVITVGYDIENLTNPEISKKYKGPVTADHYGRLVPKHAHGTENIGRHTSSTRLIIDAAMKLFDRIVDPNLLVRRMNIVANHVIYEKDVVKVNEPIQYDLFTDYEEVARKEKAEEEELLREKKMQKAILDIKKKYGKNAVLKGMNLQEGATTISRNGQIGGHKA